MNSPQFVEARKARSFLCTLAAGVLCGASAASAANIAPLGSGILGVNTAINSTYGINIANSGTTLLINNGLINDGVDTFNTANPGVTVSFVGIAWSAPRTDQILSLTLNMETFFDGGWFGPNSSSPGNGGALSSTYLIDPTVQFTTNSNPMTAADWTNAPASSNYLSVFNGHVIGFNGGTNPTVPPAATWTLTAPLTGVTGIRLIGSEGGLAASQGGFIGVRELAVDAVAVPEPSAFLALIGGAAFIGLRRRTR